MRLVWDHDAWEDYVSWQTQDRKTLRRINLLLEDIHRNGHQGIGKPEQLRFEFALYWSRRIDQEHRLVYKVENAEIVIVQCRYHY